MAESNTTDGGRIVKMEVDYSSTCDEKIPICKVMASEGKINEALEIMYALEKQTRTVSWLLFPPICPTVFLAANSVLLPFCRERTPSPQGGSWRPLCRFALKQSSGTSSTKTSSAWQRGGASWKLPSPKWSSSAANMLIRHLLRKSSSNSSTPSGPSQLERLTLLKTQSSFFPSEIWQNYFLLPIRSMSKSSAPDWRTF